MPYDVRKQAIASVERSMVAIRRSQTRRALARLLDRTNGSAVALSHSFVVDALDQSEERPPTVGEVAARLGAEASRASRMVSSAVKAGYVRRVVSELDGRSVGLELTKAGRTLAETARQTRFTAFRQAMRDWSDEECEIFARLLLRFVGAHQTHQSSVAARDKAEDTPKK